MEKSKHEQYQQARNKLIPFAERYANNAFGKECDGDREVYVRNWNTAFLGRMDELAKENEL